MFCRSLFFLFSFFLLAIALFVLSFFWPLHCLFFPSYGYCIVCPSFGHCIVCPFLLLAIALSVLSFFWPLHCLFFSSFGHWINRFLHTFLGKTGWSSTSDRNVMSFREWSAAKRAKRNKHFYHERKITRAFLTTHVSTYFFLKPTTFTIANA